MNVNRIQINDFRQFQQVDLTFESNLIAIGGQNGEGKSTLIEAIRAVFLDSSLDSLTEEYRRSVIRTIESAQFASVIVTLSNGTVYKRTISPHTDVFMINGKVTSLSDYQQNLEDMNLFQQFCVPQTEVLKISNSSPSQIFKEFRKTIGVNNFQEKKVQVEKDLKISEQRMTKFGSLVDELQSKKDLLQQKRQEFDEYNRLNQERKQVDNIIMGFEKLEYEQQLVMIQTKIKQVSLEVKVIQEQLLASQQEYESYLKNGQSLESSFSTYQLQLNSLQDIQNSLIQSINEANVNSSSDSLIVYQTTSTQLTNQLYELKKQKVELQKIIDNQKQQLDFVNIFGGNIKDFQTAGQQKIEDNDKQIVMLNEKILILTQETTDFNHQILSINQQIDSVDAYKLNSQITKEQQNFQQLQQQLQDFIIGNQANLRQIQQKQFQKQKLFQELSRSVNLQGYQFIEQQILTQHPDYTSKYFGMLIETFDIDPNLFILLEAACHSLTYLVVQDSQTAIFFIKEMQKAKLSTKINFYVLNDYQPITISYSSQVQSQDNAIPLSQAVKCQTKFRNLIDNLFGRLLIVRSLSLANQLSKQFNSDCYTIEGDCVLSNGMISGGFISGTLVKMLKSYSEVSKDCLQIRDLQLENDKKIDVHKADVQRKQKEIQMQQQNLLKAQIQVQELNEQKGDIQTILRLKRDSIDEIQLQIQLHENQILLIQSFQQSKSQVDVIQLKQNVKNFDSQLNKIQQEIGVKEAELQENDVVIKRFNKDHQNLLLSQGQIQQNLILDLLHLSRLFNQNEEVYSSYDFSSLLSVCQMKLKEITQQQQVLLDRISEYESQKQQINDSVQRIQVQINDFDTNYRLLQSQLEDANEEETQIQKLLSQILNNYVSNMIYTLTFESKKEATSYLGQIQARIKLFSEINKQAIEQYEEISKNHLEASQQLDKQQKVYHELQQLYADIIRKHGNQLKESFLLVNSKFKQIFSFITQIDGYLSLRQNNQEIPEISDTLLSNDDLELVFQTNFTSGDINIAQLSGGQQTVLSLSLLLAFQQADSSFILLLDEVDAMLDTNYRKRFILLLKHLSQSLQIFMISFKNDVFKEADSIIVAKNGDFDFYDTYKECELALDFLQD